MLDELFTLFLKEKQYMHNNTPKTIRYFECSFKAFKRANKTELSKESIINFVAHMRQSGLSARPCNDYSKGMNSFFKWLFENEYVKELYKIPMMKEEQRVLSGSHNRPGVIAKVGLWQSRLLLQLCC